MMYRDARSASSWEYVDFELEIREGSPRGYPVTIRATTGSQAQGELRLPFDKQELENRLLALENALLRSGTRRRRIRSQEEQTVQTFGRELFEALLGGEARDCYEESREKARQQNKGLRLKLRVQPPEIARLPWEFLYDPDRAEYLCLSHATPLVRAPDLRQRVELLPVTPPLRILGMIASPVNLDALDVEHEKSLVEESIKGLRERGQVEFTWLQGQTWKDLQRAMRQGPWHIFHFIGHGDYDPIRDEGLIALANEAGYSRPLRAEDLAQLLKGHFHLRLVLLNSCEGARGSERDAFSSTAATLVRPGIPAVLAMQYEITDEAAIEFSRTFYEAIADGLPVDAAVAEARTSLKIEVGNTLEWGTPVLYMRSPDGRIFDISTQIRGENDAPRRYREGVEAVWADEKLTGSEAEWLSGLASRLGLSGGDAADIEREVMGDTTKAILRRQELDELYADARRAHQNREWQAVIDVFDDIHALDPAYPDPEGLLVSAREAIANVGLARRAADLYERGLRHMDAGEWSRALQCFEDLNRLEPGNQRIEALLAQARQRLGYVVGGTPPPGLPNEPPPGLPDRPPSGLPD
jgi:hypothetical protein